MARLALYRKWRPLTFDDVCGQDHITKALRAQIESGRVSHAYLFTGTRGTGKTTCAKILARAVCCEHPVHGNPCGECAACQAILSENALDVTEIDAASNNGVDNIREIREEASYAPSVLKRRVYIIDEVHMLSAGAFNALLKTLEEPPEHVLFILATTELHKVPATILSRCQRYDFRRIAPEVLSARLLDIAQREGIALDAPAAAMLARLGDGSMRDAISLFDRAAGEGSAVTVQTVAEALGIASGETLEQVFSALLAGDAAGALRVFTESYMAGRDVTSFFDELLNLIRDIYILKTTGLSEYLTSACAGDEQKLREFAQSADAGTLEFFVESISDLLSRLTRTAIKRTDAEMCLVKMALRHTAAAAAPQTAVRPAAQPSAPAGQAVRQPEQQSAPSRQAAPAPQTPVRTESAPPESGGEDIRGPFSQKVGSQVNSAVRVYLELTDFIPAPGRLTMAVPSEALGFMSKPDTVAIFEKAAAELGYPSVLVEEKGKKKTAHKASPGLEEIRRNAESLGVPIENKRQ